MRDHRILLLVFTCLVVPLDAACADPLLVINQRVSASADDAEQTPGGPVSITGNVLSVGTNAWVGMRFQNVTIPKNATIVSAYITFQSAGNYLSNPAAATLFAQASDDAAPFASTNSNISSRPRTAASLTVNPIGGYFDNMVFNTPDLSALLQEVVDRSGWASGNDLAILIRSDAGGERGTDSFDGSSTSAALLHIEYTPFSRPVAPDLLFVAVNASSLTAQEAIRREWLQWWGYRVSLISATDSQANFTAAAAANDVAYISEQVFSTDVNTKLKAAALGVVIDEPALTDDFGLCTSYITSAANSFQISKTAHYITSPFSLGALPLFSAPQPGIEAAGTPATEMVALGAFSGGGKGLLTIEAGGLLADGTKAAGRRVALPWGGNGMDFNTINTDGLTILKRSIEWAAGSQGHWKLDETSGTTATDSGPNARHGTLSGTTFAASSVPAAKVDGGVQLDGVNDYISVPNHSSLQLRSAVTISAWVKADTWGANSDVDIVLRKGDSSPVPYQLCIQDGRVTLHLNETDGTGLGTIGNTVLETGRWYHVAGTWDGTTASVYVDGKLDGTPRALSGTLPLDTRTLFLGARPGADLSDGAIDDIRLYNYALTPGEVKNLRGIAQPRGVRITKWLEIK